jgi:hypothetical protein
VNSNILAVVGCDRQGLDKFFSPLPLQSRTRTPTILADLATPYTVPAAMDASADPCPKQSMAFSLELIAFHLQV